MPTDLQSRDPRRDLNALTEHLYWDHTRLGPGTYDVPAAGSIGLPGGGTAEEKKALERGNAPFGGFAGQNKNRGECEGPLLGHPLA